MSWVMQENLPSNLVMEGVISSLKRVFKKKINCQWFYLEEILREVLIRIMVGFVTNKTCVCYNTIKKVREGSQGVVSWEFPSNWFPFTIVLIYWIHHGFQKCFHWILCERGTRSSKTWSKVAWMCFILMVWDNIAKNLWARGSLVASNLRKQSCSNSACSAARMPYDQSSLPGEMHYGHEIFLGKWNKHQGSIPKKTHLAFNKAKGLCGTFGKFHSPLIGIGLLDGVDVGVRYHVRTLVWKGIRTQEYGMRCPHLIHQWEMVNIIHCNWNRGPIGIKENHQFHGPVVNHIG